MNKRGVYFFVIDAFIGSAIVLLSLAIILATYENVPENRIPQDILQDFMVYLQTTQVRDFYGNYTQQLILDGNVSDSTYTLYEQIAEFHRTGDIGMARNLMDEVGRHTFTSQSSFEYYYDGTLIYSRENIPKSEAKLVLSSRRVSLHLYDVAQAYGPHIVEVIIWNS